MREVTALDIDVMYRTIGANVMRIRKEKGMIQLDLALAMGLKSVGLVSVAELYHNLNTSTSNTSIKYLLHSTFPSPNSSNLPPQSQQLNQINNKSVESIDQH